eukprot:scaffold22626_cov108-Isochrysis_galbana.AAC.2
MEQLPADARATPSASAPNDIVMDIASSPKRPRDPAQDNKVSQRATHFDPAMLEIQRPSTLEQSRVAHGLAARESREVKLAAKRAKHAAKAQEKARLAAVVLATRYSELVSMGIDDLKDQLKKHKLNGKTGFNVSHPNRTAYVLLLQTLLLQADSSANDLPEGDSGIEGRNIKRKARVAGGGKKKRKRPAGVTEYMGYEWTKEEEDEFEVEAIVGKVVADGSTAYANQGKAARGTLSQSINQSISLMSISSYASDLSAASHSHSCEITQSNPSLQSGM